MIKRAKVLGFVFTVAVLATAPARSESALDCFSEDIPRRIGGCTALLEGKTLSPGERSAAYASRALALSLRGSYSEAIDDYDQAIAITPNNSVSLNNRAWAYFKWGRAPQGLPDVEKSLQISPFSSHAFDTRAHIRQVMGNSGAALQDYDNAMRFGGTRMIKMYQCGLTEAGLYKGALDGQWNEEVGAALAQCVKSTTCDPLPADEQCRPGIS